jgi:hypothetical protein
VQIFRDALSIDVKIGQTHLPLPASSIGALTIPVGLRKQFAVFQFFPATGAGFRNGVVVDQITGKSARRAIIEQNKHLRPWGWRFRAMRRECQNGLNLFARHAEFFHQLVNAHILKVLKYGGYRRPGAWKGEG